jgi:hypothetical protein
MSELKARLKNPSALRGRILPQLSSCGHHSVHLTRLDVAANEHLGAPAREVVDGESDTRRSR